MNASHLESFHLSTSWRRTGNEFEAAHPVADQPDLHRPAPAAGLAAHALIERVIAEWGGRFADQQVRYHKSKALQPILREVALAKQLAPSSAIRPWAADPGNPTLHQTAMRELESFRQDFLDRSYFVALAATGQYFHNNWSEPLTVDKLRRLD